MVSNICNCLIINASVWNLKVDSIALKKKNVYFESLFVPFFKKIVQRRDFWTTYHQKRWPACSSHSIATVLCSYGNSHCMKFFLFLVVVWYAHSLLMQLTSCSDIDTSKMHGLYVIAFKEMSLSCLFLVVYVNIENTFRCLKIGSKPNAA